MIYFPAADRNKDPILEVLQKYFPVPKVGAVEISSGTGQHVSHFAKSLPHIIWQPSEIDAQSIESIKAFIEHFNLKNVCQPIRGDVLQPVESWIPRAFKPCDFILCVNLIHISPWQCTLGLMKIAGKLLKPNGHLFLYGPFAMHGVIAPESNVQFHQTLRSRTSAWGLRDIDDVEKVANENGMKILEIIDMPANNKTVVFQKE
ncbi:hypothetical protein LOTGIDRAFT_123440 [Lottia gigantea]|uniref:Methyltransferase type 12 domain-containing protein n=1 Tax=Lottia gigantea TaxID=225164 RepID=V4A5Y8_LOTGI|nr:hypothetical protein LOTGIDRAFT_123440 [Lottia gigantea]ESO90395.1 hypothetical protein LOTGIDRAFT_123440 [Lottia gigantea]